jgi:EAL domain-containing protein (putative c-di-GMP-specific phosphodiesterase class I)
MGPSTRGVDAGGLATVLRDLSDPLVVMGRVTDEVLRLIDAAEGAAVELVDDDGLRCVCGTGILGGLVGTRVSLGASLSGLAMQQGATLRCDDAREDVRIHRQSAAAVRAVSVVCVPLRCTDRLVGALNVAATSPAAFSDRDVATLAALSSFMTATVTAVSDLYAATGELMSADHPDLDTAGMSGFVANVLQPGILADLEAMRQMEQILQERQFTIAFQPIVDVRTGRVVMVEALSRFTPEPYRSPDVWFADAWRTGIGPELELAVVAAAVSELDRVPRGARMALNLSPEAVTDPALTRLLGPRGGSHFTIELTEHVAVDDYPRVRRALRGLRALGVQLAIDDTGAGFASLSHIIKLEPDVIKLDRELIHGIDHDPVRRSLATAIAHFAADIGATVVAEAVETPAELEAVRALGITLAQGYLLARPGPLDQLSAGLYACADAPAKSA